MEPQPQNQPSASERTNQSNQPNQPAAANTTADKQSAQSPGQAQGSAQSQSAAPSATAGTEQISGLNATELSERAIGAAKQLGELNAQTGAAGKATSAEQKEVTSRGQNQSRLGAATEGNPTDNPGRAQQWQALQSTLQQGWTSLTQRVRAASPAQLALGAAAVGAAVWLGTRKRGAKAKSGYDQSSADRWSDYPSGSDGSRSEGRYGQYEQAGKGWTPRSQASGLPSGSQATSGRAAGAPGQADETWQRPTHERWDD